MQGTECKADAGLGALALLLRFHGGAIDPGQITHRFAGAPIRIAEMLRCAKELKLRARAISVDWPRLAGLQLPGIVACRADRFMILGRIKLVAALILSFGAYREKPAGAMI